MIITDIEIARLFILGALTDLTNRIEWSVKTTDYGYQVGYECCALVDINQEIQIHASTFYLDKIGEINAYALVKNVENVISETLHVFSKRLFLDNDMNDKFKRTEFYKNAQNKEHGDPTP